MHLLQGLECPRGTKDAEGLILLVIQLIHHVVLELFVHISVHFTEGLKEQLGFMAGEANELREVVDGTQDELLVVMKAQHLQQNLFWMKNAGLVTLIAQPVFLLHPEVN